MIKLHIPINHCSPKNNIPPRTPLKQLSSLVHLATVYIARNHTSPTNDVFRRHLVKEFSSYFQTATLTVHVQQCMANNWSESKSLPHILVNFLTKLQFFHRGTS
uniref:Uncharacterized protein n=1 Tax=Rhizophora mucronata TaxID=61149 RepID=A0A2P2P0Q2_RHIMU